MSKKELQRRIEYLENQLKIKELKSANPKEKVDTAKKLYKEYDFERGFYKLLPRNQRYNIMLFMDADDNAYQLYYSFAFDLFMKYCRTVVRKYILDGDNNLTPEIITSIYDEVSKFHNTTLKEYDEDLNKRLNESNKLYETAKEIAETNINKKYKNIYEKLKAIPNWDDYSEAYDKLKKISPKLLELVLNANENELEDEHREIKKLYDIVTPLKEKYEEIRELQKQKGFGDIDNNYKRIIGGEKRRNDILKEKCENDRKNMITNFYLQIKKDIDNKNTVKYEKDLKYIKKLFNDFCSKNYVKLKEMFQEQYQIMNDTLYLFLGSYPTMEKAKKFVEMHKEELNIGKLVIQPAGSWCIVNPKSDDTEYIDKTLNTIMQGYNNKTILAKKEFNYRKAILKEKESRKRGDIINSFTKTDLDKVEVDKNNVVDNPLSNMEDSILNREYELYNPVDQSNLIIKDDEDDEHLNDVKDLLDTEFDIGFKENINIEMLKKAGYSDDKIKEVKEAKEKKYKQEFDEIQKNLMAQIESQLK